MIYSYSNEYLALHLVKLMFFNCALFQIRKTVCHVVNLYKEREYHY